MQQKYVRIATCCVQVTIKATWTLMCKDVQYLQAGKPKSLGQHLRQGPQNHEDRNTTNEYALQVNQCVNSPDKDYHPIITVLYHTI